jgi:hypothetical protein
MSIPAKKLVEIIPGVIGAGGAALALSGLILTADTAVPFNTIRQFSDAEAVATFFGPQSSEAAIASVYFAGFDGSTQKPGNLLFSQYPIAPVAAYTRSASLAAMTLAQLQAITPGVMTVTVDGTLKTSASINLSTATSFSDAAAKITTAFASGPVVTYDAQRAAFVATSGTTGGASTITFAAGAIATALNLTQATGAVTSQGSAAATPAAAMTAIIAKALNWAGFMTVFEPVIADKMAFATWTGQQADRFAYACWDTDVTSSQQGNTTAFGPQVAALQLSGSIPLGADPAQAAALGVSMTSLVRPLAAFVLGYMASIDFGQTNGRTTAAFRSQGGIVAGCADSTVADTLVANGYNFYGDYATSQQAFRFMQPGQISGRFKWLDSFANEIWMNANFQQSLLAFMAAAGSIPYNNFGYASIETALQTPINQALDFGAIRAGVSLSGSQVIAVNSASGQKIDTVLSTRGWYLSIKDPGAAARAARTTPSMTFYYCDGGSIQQMKLASLLVQ